MPTATTFRIRRPPQTKETPMLDPKERLVLVGVVCLGGVLAALLGDHRG